MAKKPTGVTMVTFRFRIAADDLTLAEKACRRVSDVTIHAMAHRIFMQGVRKILASPSPEDEAMLEAAMADARRRAEKGPDRR